MRLIVELAGEVVLELFNAEGAGVGDVARAREPRGVVGEERDPSPPARLQVRLGVGRERAARLVERTFSRMQWRTS